MVQEAAAGLEPAIRMWTRRRGKAPWFAHVPWVTRQYKHLLAGVPMVWPRQAHLHQVVAASPLAALVASVAAGEEQGPPPTREEEEDAPLVLEFGVAGGRSIRSLAESVGPSVLVHGFDSFIGKCCMIPSRVLPRRSASLETDVAVPFARRRIARVVECDD